MPPKPPKTTLPRSKDEWEKRCRALDWSRANTPFNLHDPASASKVNEEQFLSLNTYWTHRERDEIEKDLRETLIGQRFDQYLVRAENILSTHTGFQKYMECLPKKSNRRKDPVQVRISKNCDEFYDVRWNHLLVCEQLDLQIFEAEQPPKVIRTPRKTIRPTRDNTLGEDEQGNMSIFANMSPIVTVDEHTDSEYREETRRTAQRGRQESVFESYVLSLHQALYRLISDEIIVDMPNLKPRMKLHRLMVAIPDAIQRHHTETSERILHLLEVKAADRTELRRVDTINDVRYQETAQLAAFIQDRDIQDDYIEKQSSTLMYNNKPATIQLRGLYALGGQSLHIMFAQCPPEYVQYLRMKNVKRVDPWTNKPFMKIQEYGPFDIFKSKQLQLYCTVVIARVLEAHERLTKIRTTVGGHSGSLTGSLHSSRPRTPSSHSHKTPFPPGAPSKSQVGTSNTRSKRRDSSDDSLVPGTSDYQRTRGRSRDRRTSSDTLATVTHVQRGLSDLNLSKQSPARSLTPGSKTLLSRGSLPQSISSRDASPVSRSKQRSRDPSQGASSKPHRHREPRTPSR